MRTVRFRLSIGASRATSERVLMVAEAANEEKADGPMWRRLKTGLGKTRARLADGLGGLWAGRRAIDDAALADLEAALLGADVGVAATTRTITALSRRLARAELTDAAALRHHLGAELERQLAPMARPFVVDTSQKPYVVLVVGVNGAGKTTSLGKLAQRLRAAGHSVLLAAGDTFRAAAVEQLQVWGERNGVAVIAQGRGADSAAVIHDAMVAARARGVDIVLADTAGRLQAKTNLMGELAKIKRVARRFDPNAPHEAILVLDAVIGQNAVGQVAEFDAAVGLTGLIVAKLDGSAKAGALFAIAAHAAGRPTPLPVYFVGVGERADDLRPFDPHDFVAALLAGEGDG